MDAPKRSQKPSWTKTLAGYTSFAADAIPDGWKTAFSIAEEAGFSESHLRRVLRKAIDDGRVEMKRFRIYTGARLYPAPHYRIK